MPFVIMPWGLLDDENLTAHDILVYATIARYADGATGEAWPSRQTVAHAARCDIKTVDRAVARLVRSGYLEKQKRKNQEGETNLYVIHEIVARTGRLPSDSNGARVGTQTVRPLGTQTVRELEPLELDRGDRLDLTVEASPSEWTPMPDDVRAMLTRTKESTP
jgi:DNA-binding transcriptional MocR family regulator